MKNLKLFLIPIILFSFLILPALASAQSPLTNLGAAAPEVIKGNSSLPYIVGGIIKAILGMLGVVFLCLMVYAGFTWMTAAGEPDKVKKAKSLITNSIIGLIIVMASYAITLFVVGAVK